MYFLEKYFLLNKKCKKFIFSFIYFYKKTFKYLTNYKIYYIEKLNLKILIFKIINNNKFDFVKDYFLF